MLINVKITFMVGGNKNVRIYISIYDIVILNKAI